MQPISPRRLSRRPLRLSRRPLAKGVIAADKPEEALQETPGQRDRRNR